MEEREYYVADHNVPIARWMNLSVSLTLIQALCEKYWQDPSVCFTIGIEPYERKVERYAEEEL